MKRPQIRVWKTDHDYIVAINHDCYEMNADADMPNGVCIYLGRTEEIDFHKAARRQLDRTDYIPVGIIRQVTYLIHRQTEELLTTMLTLHAFVTDCCQTGDIMSDNPVAPMSDDDQRTVGDVLQQINNLLS
jgi:hypothetical protein